jgi:hypothetical protein
MPCAFCARHWDNKNETERSVSALTAGATSGVMASQAGVGWRSRGVAKRALPVGAVMINRESVDEGGGQPGAG